MFTPVASIARPICTLGSPATLRLLDTSYIPPRSRFMFKSMHTRPDATNMVASRPATSPLGSDAEASAEGARIEVVPLFQRQIKRTIRRTELRKIVPLADTTIYELEQRGEFPRRFYLTPRCVVWDLAEVEAWVQDRRRASDMAAIKRTPSPDVRQRKVRPVRR
jgi:prophage regulatory protein